MSKLKLFFFTGVICCLAIIGCKKQNEWLDIQKDPNDKTLKVLKDFQAVLDNSTILNFNYPTIGQLGADHYFLSDQYFNLSLPTDRNAYVWNSDVFEGRISADYNDSYTKIAYANIVLDGLRKIQVGINEQSEFNDIRGQALFFRSFIYFELASIFCKQYVNQTANSDLGLCLKLTSNIYEIEQRSSIESTFNLIVNDLEEAALALPIVAKYKTRPSKLAAYALLARVYLNMGNYVKAREACDSVLRNNVELLNFNEVPSLTLEYRFPNFKAGNKEVLFHSEGIGYTAVVPDYNFNYGYVDTMLYESYDEYDLRRKYFFESQTSSTQVKYRGTYTGTGFNFCGLAINEVYITRAECNARLNNIQASLNDLNLLLVNRYERGRFVNYQADNKDTLLSKILLERKKELSFTGQIRWQDLRRLNIDPRFATYITRIIAGQTITLPPNDRKYVYPIPQDEIDRTGIVQNER